MSVQEFIENRQAGFLDAFNRRSIEDLDKYFSDEDLDYSDLGNLTTHMSKEKVLEFFANSFKTCGDMKTTTVSVSGTKEFSVWEWDLTFYATGLMPGDDGKSEFATKVADGRFVQMIGVSVTWWNADGMKIIKNNDYSKVVKTFEGLRTAPNKKS